MVTSHSDHTATLLNNGKVLVAGGYGSSGSYLSQSELYIPSGEMMLSHDYGLKGDQTNPKIVVDGGVNPIVVWQDTRSFIGNTVTTDTNVFMQKFNSIGEPQWPSAVTTGSYTSPYTVMDIRADTYGTMFSQSGMGGTGTHYSGKPSIGVTQGLSDNTRRLIVAFEDNRNDTTTVPVSSCGYNNTSTLTQACAQSYDLNEYNINQLTSWNVYFHANNQANLDLAVKITEWDGTQIASQSGNKVWSSCSPACPSQQTVTFTTGATNYPNPPSDLVGNVTMRRLMVTFTRTLGQTVISYDNSPAGTYDSRLTTGTIVPEKSIILSLVIPFLPPVIYYLLKRRRKYCHARIL